MSAAGSMFPFSQTPFSTGSGLSRVKEKDASQRPLRVYFFFFLYWGREGRWLLGIRPSLHDCSCEPQSDYVLVDEYGPAPST